MGRKFWDRYRQNAIVEISSDIGSVRRGGEFNGPLDAAIAPLNPVLSRILYFMLLLPLPFYNQVVFIDGNINITLVDTREIYINNDQEIDFETYINCN